MKLINVDKCRGDGIGALMKVLDEEPDYEPLKVYEEVKAFLNKNDVKLPDKALGELRFIIIHGGKK